MSSMVKGICLPESLSFLPAAKKSKELIDLMKTHSVIVVEGETGSGKSVVLPTVIAEHYGREYSRVIVTQNRRILCDSIASFISQSMNCEVGTPVGFQFKGERKRSSNTLLSFETTGTVLGHLKSNPMLSGIPCIVVDEIHEGTVDQHVLLGHLKKILDSNSNFRIVLMSATLSSKDKKRFNDFFGCPVGYLTVEGRTYPVERHFSGHSFNIDKPYQQLKKQIMSATSDTIAQAYNDISEGTILAFLPGKSEIADVARRLSFKGLASIPLHAEVTENQKQKAISGANGKKIVLCTEVARSGLTVEGVKVVVSSGFARNGQVDKANQVTGICTSLTDWASLQQEGGRTGRTCPGIHYIVGQEKTKRAAYPEIALNRNNILGSILSILSTVDDFSSFEWFETPDENQLLNVFKKLGEIGAIELKPQKEKGWPNAMQESITPLGRVLSRMPVDPQIGKFLLVSKYLGVEKEGAILASVLLNKVKIPKSWSDFKLEKGQDGSLRISQVYENDLEAVLTEYEKGYFSSVNYGSVVETVNELLMLLSAISDEEMSCIQVHNTTAGHQAAVDTLKEAVIYSFGHNAGMFVPAGASLILNECVYGLAGNAFYTKASDNTLSFQLSKKNRFNNSRLNGLILVPLNLFLFEKDYICNLAIEVSLNELKPIQPGQSFELASISKGMKAYKGRFKRTPEEHSFWSAMS